MFLAQSPNGSNRHYIWGRSGKAEHTEWGPITGVSSAPAFGNERQFRLPRVNSVLSLSTQVQRELVGFHNVTQVHVFKQRNETPGFSSAQIG